MKSVKKHLFRFFIVLFALISGCGGSSGSGDIGGPQLGSKANQDLNLPPEFFTFAIIGGEETTLNGSSIVVKEASDPQLNANVHSNDKVLLNGETITIEGFVTYVNNIIINGDNISITPNNNPNNKPPHYQASKVVIPNIDIANYKSIADIIYDGDKQLSGNINLGTRSDPLIIYIGGNLHLDNVVFNGYGVIIAAKEVDIVSDVMSSSPDPIHSKVLIIVGSKFIMNNSSTTLHAAVYAKDEVNINAENSFIEGSLATLRKNTLNNNRIDVRFKPIDTGLSKLIFGSS